MSQSYYWHDYETWGSDPRRDRPCQFAGLRTDSDLNEVGEPLYIYCRPPTDALPHPEACLVTGITPQRAEREGLIETAFAGAIHAELSQPGTCGVGYNSLRFDDEVTRHLFYRNFLDPYAREWQNGGSRWDLIDPLRLAHALRPEGIEWPTDEGGIATFRLERLTAANGIDHGQAHDALADVRATIAMARLLRRAQPKLFDYALTLRDKRQVRTLLERDQPLLHVSARYPAALGCMAPVIAVAPHPTNGNGVICFDLRADPDLLLELPVEELRRRLFTPAAELEQGVSRIPLKTVHVNRSPMVAPMKTLSGAAAERWDIHPDQAAERAARIRTASAEIRARVQAVHQDPRLPPETDPDLMLYAGGFFSDQDRRVMTELRRRSPLELAEAAPKMEDKRLPEMLFRYRARNWPETLSAEERETWDAFRLARLTDPEAGGGLRIDEFEERLRQLSEQHAGEPAKLKTLSELADWAELVMDAAI